ncbi:MAG: ATP-dependent zinc metalloprotease FtsH [Bdellovibrionales bacterium]|nr:ATP-dependent zinc metalloprotease FtsH [Bdellovibrionales bacterium]
MWGIIVIMALMISQGILKYSVPAPESISYSTFLEKVRLGVVASVKINENEIQGEYNPIEASEEVKEGEVAKPTKFTTEWIGTGDELSRFLEEQKIAGNLQDYKYESLNKETFWRTHFFNYLFIGISILILFMIFRQIQAGGGKAMSFGKSRARLVDEQKKKVTFKDVAGVDEAKEELEEIIDFLKDPQKFTGMGVRIPKGVLLIGPPGTGKTLLAKAVAGEAGVPFFSISGSDFVELFVGVGASRVRDLFEQGRKNAPCIIFIDEIDAVGRQRGAGLGGGHDEREQTLNQLLVEMDGFEPQEGVILIAATNRADVLDPALLRPGRFDRQVVVPLPEVHGRKAILDVHVKKIPVGADINLEVLAKGTVGFSGADLENLVNEAALWAARQNQKTVTMEHFEYAKDKLMLGKERKNIKMSDDEKRMTAYHEAGHALIATLSPNADPVHKVTIIPRGMALGVTHQLPEKDKYSLHKEDAETIISVLMGGRVAEEVVFGKISNGAANDIERASALARKMVCEWGMSDELGPLSYKQSNEQIFLAREMSNKSHVSEATAQVIDQEVKKIIVTNYQRAKDMVIKNRDKLDKLAQALLEKEIVTGDELRALFGMTKEPVTA